MMNEPSETPSQKSNNVREDSSFEEFCVQTGEEFSREFLRDRMGTKRVNVMPNVDHFQPTSPAFDFVREQPVANSYCNWEFSDSKANHLQSPHVDSTMHLGLGSQTQGEFDFFRQQSNMYYDDAHPGHRAVDPFNSSGSPQSYYQHGFGISEGFPQCKMKFLCSYGGRILQRPNDGKLRYVGGETRIISIRNNLSWEELFKKTSGICNQPHTIKYQLPGEDLDSLISVCSNEDLHNMIEEYRELEKVGTSQRLRLFLVPLGDPESPSSFEARLAAEQQDADYQYVVAVNGMFDQSPRKSVRGQPPAAQTVQLGASSDGSPSYRKDFSPTIAQNLEISDFSPNYPKLAQATHFLTRQVSNNPPDQSPPTPVSATRRDLMSPNHANESNRLMFLDKIPSEKPCYYDNTYYHSPVLDQPLEVADSQMMGDHSLKAEQISTQRSAHLQDHSPCTEYAPAPYYDQFNATSGRSTVKERLFHSDKLVCLPEGLRGSQGGPTELDVPPHHRMMHALSDSQLQGLTRGSSHSTEEGTISCSSAFSSEMVPLLAIPSHCSHDWRIKSQDIAVGNSREIQIADRLNKDKPMVINHKVMNLKDAKEAHYCEEKEWLGAVTKGDCTNVLQECNQSRYAPEVQQKLSSLECTKKNTTYNENMNQPVHTQSDFQEYHRPTLELTPGLPGQLAASSVSPSASCKEDKPHDDGIEASLNHTNKVGPKERSSEEPKSGSLMPDRTASEESHHYVAALASLIVEDVSENTPLDIPISSKVVAHVLDDPTEDISPPTETEGESIAAESDYEDVKCDDQDTGEPISDATIAEIEAGIYGLQIIKNADLEEIQELGSGTFGTVYHGKWRGTDVAIKRIKNSCFAGRSSEQERITKDFWREAKILSNLHHPNVVAFYGVVPDGPGGTLSTVAEFMVNGSLRHNLVRNNRALDRRKKLMIAMDAAFGMEYLHLKNIVHFDLKCDNLLVNLKDPRRPICKVGDFGLSRIKQNTFVSGGIRGTLPWMAPELLNGTNNRVSEKVDVFSFGIAMWEMLTGEEPYANMHCGAIIGGIVNNTLRPPIPDRCDSEWKKLMEECWSADPSHRPSFTEITNRLRTMLKSLQTKRHTATEKPKY